MSKLTLHPWDANSELQTKMWWSEGGVRGWELTSGTQKAPAHVDGGGEKAVLLGAAVVAADHDVMGEDDAAGGQAAVAGVVGQRAADATNQTAWKATQTVIITGHLQGSRLSLLIIYFF